MSQRVTIELSSEEVAFVRALRIYDCNSPSGRVYTYLKAALPRPIEAGDTVRWGQCTYPVLAVFRSWAWLGDDEAGPYTADLTHLVRVPGDTDRGGENGE